VSAAIRALRSEVEELRLAAAAAHDAVMALRAERGLLVAVVRCARAALTGEGLAELRQAVEMIDAWTTTADAHAVRGSDAIAALGAAVVETAVVVRACAAAAGVTGEHLPGDVPRMVRALRQERDELRARSAADGN
jgi:hypothetical protein